MIKDIIIDTIVISKYKSYSISISINYSHL